MANKEEYHVELISSGVRALLRSNEMAKAIESEAQKIAKRCGDGYTTDSHVGRNRVNTSVIASTWGAYQDNLKNNTISKALK